MRRMVIAVCCLLGLWVMPGLARTLPGVPVGEIWKVPLAEPGEVKMRKQPSENGDDPVAFATRYDLETDALLVLGREKDWLKVRLFSTTGAPEGDGEGWVREEEVEPLGHVLDQAGTALPEPRVYFKGDLDVATMGVTVTERLEPAFAGFNRRLLILDPHGNILWLAPSVHPVRSVWGPGQFGELGDRKCSLFAVLDAEGDGRMEFLVERPEPEGSWVDCDILRWNGAGFDVLVERRGLAHLTNGDAENIFLFRPKDACPDGVGVSLACAWEGLSGPDELIAAVEEEKEDAVYRGRAVFRLRPDFSGATLVRWLDQPKAQF